MNEILTPEYQNRVEINLLNRMQSEKIKVLLDKAADFLTHTKDPSHGVDHLNHMLQDADRFLRSVGDRFDIDKEILLLSLYWHDVWKSQNKPTAVNYLFQQLYEGWGSMFMFRKSAQLVGLPSQITRAVSYAIRKHSAVQLRRANTLEAQLLWDIDTLDLWNFQRTKAIFVNSRSANISLLDCYLLYLKRVGFPLHFQWTKNEVQKRKPLFFKEMSKFREGFLKANKSPQPLFMQTKTVSTKLNLNKKS